MQLANIIKLSRILSKLESVLTDRGELVSDEPLAVGVKVYDSEGEPAEDGLYITETQTITVAGGAVTEISDIEEPKTEEEVVVEQAEEPTTENEKPDEKDAKIAELSQYIAELEAKIAELEAKLSEKEDELKNANEKLSAPIAEQKKEVKAPIFKSYLK